MKFKNGNVKNRAIELDKILKQRSLNQQINSTPSMECKINDYITLKLVHGKTLIYVNGKIFLQCIRLILNIPKKDVHLYDNIDSIDEAAELYQNYIFQNRLVEGQMARPLFNQSHDITPEEEFWGHCSNIQAWVEHNYDTRILKSNVSFPLLRELVKAGDIKARQVYKDEIALRLESGYPSVVEYLINQHYIADLTPLEFQTIIESTNLINNILSFPKALNSFIQTVAMRFPESLEDILVKIYNIPNGKDILISSFETHSSSFYSRINPIALISLKRVLYSLKMMESLQYKQETLEFISTIENLLITNPKNILDSHINQKLVIDALLREMFEKEEFGRRQRKQELLQDLQHKCSYCGKIIPKGSDTCDWCGHRKDDEGGSYPYLYYKKPPGGGVGAAIGKKLNIVIVER